VTRAPLDTAPDVALRYREMLMARSASDRLLMGLCLFDLARATVLARLATGCDEAARRVHLFINTYGRDFDADSMARIVEQLESSAPRHD
jgi:hypothetical protein